MYHALGIELILLHATYIADNTENILPLYM